MDKYIIARVSSDRLPDSYSTGIGALRKAMHDVSKELDFSVADMVTHSRFMTRQESRTVRLIFEQALNRAKERQLNSLGH